MSDGHFYLDPDLPPPTPKRSIFAQITTTDDTVVRLHSTTDARVWAQEWCRIARAIQDRGDEIIDEGWMIGWFANAIEVGRDAGLRADAEGRS